MSAGGSFNPSGGPIDNQQRLQTSPNPSLPPADYSMGDARNFQPPSFFNPFSGYSGANTGMGGFQSQFGGFQQPQFGGFGGFGGFQQPQYGGFQQPQYGGFQQPQFGGFGGGFQQPFDGGYGGGFQQPFSGGFGGQSNRFTRRGQSNLEYTQPYNPQPNQPDYGNMNRLYQPDSQGRPQFQPMPQPLMEEVQPNPNRGGGGMGGDSLFSSLASMRQSTTPYSTFNPNANETDEERRIRVNDMTFGPLQARAGMGAPRGTGGITANMSGMGGYGGGGMGGGSRGQRLDDGAYGYDGGGAYGGNFGGFNPMIGDGIGAFGGFQRQFNPYGNANAEPRSLQQQQRGTVDQNMNNPAFKRQQDAYNTTDYQRLMQRKNQAANAPPAPPMSGLVGLGGMPIRAPSDYEIANSLGYGDLGLTDMRAKMPEEYQQEETTRQARAKSYLDSIGYGQTSFDPSKYEVKREVQPSGNFGSLFSGLGRGFAQSS